MNNNLLIWNPWFFRIWSIDSFTSTIYDIAIIAFFIGLIALTIYLIKQVKYWGYAFLSTWVSIVIGVTIYDFTKDNYQIALPGQAMIAYVSENKNAEYNIQLDNIRKELSSNDISVVSENSKNIIDSGLKTNNFIISSYMNKGEAYGNVLLNISFIEFSGSHFSDYDYTHISKNGIISHHNINLLIPEAKFNMIMDLAKKQNTLLEDAISHMDKNSTFFKQNVLNSINNHDMTNSTSNNININNY